MATSSESESARAAVRIAFDAYEGRRWGEFAGFVHDDALAEFRRYQLAMAEGWEQHPSGFLRGSTGSDDPVVTELEQQLEELTSHMGNPALRGFAGVGTVAELRALEPAETLARFLEGYAPRANPSDPDYVPPHSRREIIGEVTEHPDLVHVVYRVHTDAGRHGRVEEIMVVPVRHTTSGWRLMLNQELSFIGSMNSVGDHLPG